MRAFHPWPGTSFELNGERIKVLEAGLALAGGAPGTVNIARDGFPIVDLRLGRLAAAEAAAAGQVGAIAADAFLRGFALPAGTVLPAATAVSLPQSRRPDVPRYKISVEYDGGPFVGWQRQDTGPSIQAALEDAIFAFSGER